MILLATLATLIVVNSETLVILSNFVVAISTLLLWAASEHEQHQTIRAIMRLFKKSQKDK